jgi:hypothetical protein
VGFDTGTQGNWPGVYGADGKIIVNDVVNPPGYASVTPSGNLFYVWAASTGDPRALQRQAGGRTAATWYGSTFDIDVATTGGPHRIALYSVDWDGGGRAQRFDVLDGATLAVLDSRTINNFGNGVWSVWSITGHVVIRVTLTGGVNAVVSGVFFSPGPAPAPEPAPMNDVPPVAEAGSRERR